MFEIWTCHVVACDTCGRPVDEDDETGPIEEVSMSEAIRNAEAAGYLIETDNRATCPQCLAELGDDDDDDDDDEQLSFPI